MEKATRSKGRIQRFVSQTSPYPDSWSHAGRYQAVTSQTAFAVRSAAFSVIAVLLESLDEHLDLEWRAIKAALEVVPDQPVA